MNLFVSLYQTQTPSEFNISIRCLDPIQFCKYTPKSSRFFDLDQELFQSLSPVKLDVPPGGSARRGKEIISRDILSKNAAASEARWWSIGGDCIKWVERVEDLAGIVEWTGGPNGSWNCWTGCSGWPTATWATSGGPNRGRRYCWMLVKAYDSARGGCHAGVSMWMVNVLSFSKHDANPMSTLIVTWHWDTAGGGVGGVFHSIAITHSFRYSKSIEDTEFRWTSLSLRTVASAKQSWLVKGSVKICFQLARWEYLDRKFRKESELMQLIWINSLASSSGIWYGPAARRCPCSSDNSIPWRLDLLSKSAEQHLVGILVLQYALQIPCSSKF